MVIEEHAKLELFLPGSSNSPIIIPEENIIQNSLSVTSQCVNGNVFAFGCVSPAQLSVKFRIPESGNLNRYDIYGSKIRLYSHFGSENFDQKKDLRGVFNVTSVTKNNDMFIISAFDNICLLDSTAFLGKNLGNIITERLSGGFRNAYNAFSILGEIVKEYTHENISFFVVIDGLINSPDGFHIPNGQAEFIDYDCGDPSYKEIRLITLLSEEQSDNIRDYTSWLAEYMGGFVHTRPDGNIQFSLFENPWMYKYRPEFCGRNEVKTLNFSDFEQNTLEIAGFQIHFCRAKAILEDKNFNQCPWDDSDKITENSVINLENIIQNNPFIEYAYQSHLASNNANIFPIVEALQCYQRNIQIRPFSGTYHGSEYLYPGQYVQVTDKDGTAYGTTITNITWKFRGGQQIQCIGEDSRTLSQARKRSQAVRMGERLKTQINRLRNELKN